MAKVMQLNGSFEGPPGADGKDGKSAYEYAQDGGYTGTEEEFAEKLATNLQLDATLRDDTKAAPAGIVGKLKGDLADKLDKPETAPAVGKILKIKQVNEDGTFTCEWADGGGVGDVQINGTSIVGEDGVAKIPTLKRGTFGLPFINSTDSYRESDGIDVDDRFGNIKVIPSPTWRIDTRATYTVITPTNLDYAVKAAMCDGKGAAWTDAERLACLLRIGCTVDENGFVKWTAQGVTE